MRLVQNSHCYDKDSGAYLGRLVAVSFKIAGIALVVRSGKIGAAQEKIVRPMLDSCYVVAPIGKNGCNVRR